MLVELKDLRSHSTAPRVPAVPVPSSPHTACCQEAGLRASGRCCGGTEAFSHLLERDPSSLRAEKTHLSFSRAKVPYHLQEHRCGGQPRVGQTAWPPPPQATLSQTFPQQPGGSMATEQEEIQVKNQGSFPIYFPRK